MSSCLLLQGVMERKLGTCGTEADHCAGTLLKPSITVVSNRVADNVRTVVLTRPFAGVRTPPPPRR